MTSTSFLKRAVPDAGDVLKRFPVAIAAFALLAGTLIRYDAWSLGWPAAWVTGVSATAFSAVAIALWSEARAGRPAPLFQLLALVIGLGAGLLNATPWISVLWLHVALIGAILLAPAPGKSEPQLWSFDTRLCAMAAFAGIAAGVVVLGLICVIAAADYLFGLRLADAGVVARFGFVFAMPVYWLALAQGHDAELLGPSDLLTKAAASLGALVAGVSLLMAALLHLYTAKIALAGEMPKNQVGWIVSSTLAAGLCGWLLAAGETGPAAGLRRLFRRWWFALTAVPVVLLAAAIHERIGVYGVTLERYAVAAAAAASLGFIGVALLRRRTPSIRAVLAVAIVVAAFAAIGPFNMPNVVATSQIARLKDKLAAAGLLRDGRVETKLPEGSWNAPAAVEIQSIVAEIYQVGAEDRLAPIVPTDTLKSAYQVQTFLAADGIVRRAGVDPVAETFSRFGAVEVGAGTFVGQFSINRPSGPEQIGSILIDGRVVRLETRRLTIVEDDRETAFDLAPLDVAFDKTRQPPLAIRSVDGRSQLIVNSARIRKTPGGNVAEWISGSAVIAKP